MTAAGRHLPPRPALRGRLAAEGHATATPSLVERKAFTVKRALAEPGEEGRLFWAL